MCFLEECKSCKEYSKCPILSSIVQRSYANRVLDEILKSLNNIEKMLEKG
jgi:hypothetical protein